MYHKFIVILTRNLCVSLSDVTARPVSSNFCTSGFSFLRCRLQTFDIDFQTVVAHGSRSVTPISCIEFICLPISVKAFARHCIPRFLSINEKEKPPTITTTPHGVQRGLRDAWSILICVDKIPLGLKRSQWLCTEEFPGMRLNATKQMTIKILLFCAFAQHPSCESRRWGGWTGTVSEKQGLIVNGSGQLSFELCAHQTTNHFFYCDRTVAVTVPI